jgi:hypothetical protein
MKKKLLIDELLRLACIYAECDRKEYLRCVGHIDSGEAAETKEFLKQLRAYRLKRWGKTKQVTSTSSRKTIVVISTG